MNAFLLSSDGELRAQINRLCAQKTPPITLLSALPSMHRDVLPPISGQPDLVIFDANSYPHQSEAMLSRMTETFPLATVVLLSSDRSPDFLISVMRAGVREVLSLPLVTEELDAALDRLSHKVKASVTIDAKVIVLAPCKGGSGVTFLAANLAHAFSVIAHKRVLLIDMNPVFGDAALYLSDLKPARTLLDVCQDIHRLDINLLETSVLKISPLLSLLAAADDPDPAQEIQADHVERLLHIARLHYDFIVIDTGRYINATAIRALDSADLICPVLQQSLPYLRDARRLLDIYASLGYRKEKIQCVLNRFESNAGLSLAEIERVLGQKIAQRIPNHFEIVNDSINQGRPVLQLARSSDISKALSTWVNRLVEVPTPARGGMLRRIFERHPVNSGLMR